MCMHLRLYYIHVSVGCPSRSKAAHHQNSLTCRQARASAHTKFRAGMGNLAASAVPQLMLLVLCFVGLLVGSSGYPANGRWYASSTWMPMGIELLVQGGGGFGGNPTEARWQTDCNLVLYRRNDPYWSTDTAKYKNHICYLAMQRDGNLVIYGDNQQPLWASNSGNREDADYYVQIQIDGNFVIYKPSGDPIWASETDHWG